MRAEWRDLLCARARQWRRGGAVVRVPAGRDVVFVGDIHGDIEAVREVRRCFGDKGVRVIFLGDYVDRGAASAEVLSFLLSWQQEAPAGVILLRGNHEAWARCPFSPADFWEGLTETERREAAVLLDQLPLLAVGEGWAALHGALPPLRDWRMVEEREREREVWRPILWGDWQDEQGGYLGEWEGRPQYGRAHFERVMGWWGKHVLIRSHQPRAPRFLFARRCLTVFTSASYGAGRAVALLPAGRLRGKRWSGRCMEI